MLEGIEIIKQTEIMVEQSAANPIVDIITWIFVFLPIIYYLILGGAIFITKYGNKILKILKKTAIVIWLFLPIVISFVACLVNCLNEMRIKEVPTGKYIYEVTVDDKVGLKEFYEYYEVLDVKDDVFVIKEKN